MTNKDYKKNTTIKTQSTNKEKNRAKRDTITKSNLQFRKMKLKIKKNKKNNNRLEEEKLRLNYKYVYINKKINTI